MDRMVEAPESVPDYCPTCGGMVVPDPAGESPCPHCGQLLWFVRKPIGRAVVLTFLPGLAAGSEGGQRIGEVTAAVQGASRVVINLAPLRLVSSLFLGMLLVLQRRVAAAGGTMKLCGLQPAAREACTATRLDTVFDIHLDVPSALAAA